MDSKTRDKLKNRLESRFGFLRRAAVKRLAADASADAVDLLILAMEDANAKNSALAVEGLSGLTDQDAVNRFCTAWAQSRPPALDEILVRKRYLAQCPARLHILTALKTGQPPRVEPGERLETLVAALDEKDQEIARNADRALHNLDTPAVIDAFCVLWEPKRDARLTAILQACKYVAQKPARLHVLTALKTDHAPQIEPGERLETLVAALDEKDQEIARNADRALHNLDTPAVIDAFCVLWEPKRDARLTAILQACKYVAQKPARLHVLTALKTDHAPQIEPGERLETLVAALDEKDQEIARNADRALRNLDTPAVIDAFCVLWEPKRDARLTAILQACKYVAQKPARLHVLTALKASQTPRLETEEQLDAVATALEDRDKDIAQNAAATIAEIRNKVWWDILIDRAVNDPRGRLARICTDGKFRHGNDSTYAVFLVVTGRIDAFFAEFRGAEEEGMRLLRMAYERAPETLRTDIMRAVRSGDRRMNQFFLMSRPRCELNEQDILEEIESGLRHKDWPHLFNVFLDVPLRYTFHLIEHFETSDWEPDKPDDQALYNRVREAARGVHVTPSGRKSNPGSGGDVVANLITLIDNGTPVQAAGAAGILAATGAADDAVCRRVAKHKSLFVRAAGRWTGLCPDNMFQKDDAVLTMPRHEVPREALDEALGGGVLDLWPSKASPKDIEALNNMPEKAFQGSLGAVRKVLRAILEMRMDMVVGGIDTAHIHEGAVTGGREPDMGFE